MAKKIFIILTSCLIIILISLTSIVIANTKNYKSTGYKESKSFINPTSNFFGLPENKTLVNTSTDLTTLESNYQLIGETSRLKLYLEKKTLGIAIYDKDAQYIWYSCYKDYKTKGYTQTVRTQIESGVRIEYYDSETLNENTKYSSNNKDCTITYDFIENGVIAHLNFKTIAISFDVLIKIEDKDLICEALLDTLKEEKYESPALKFPKEYKLKSITLFPYLGADNYNINAYAFIPDGSGALIRYQNQPFTTAFIKRVFGKDLGIQLDFNQEYLKQTNEITLPIYGINHGYHQAAFLTQIESGFGSTELHSYPYMYETIDLNRTFFKYIVRDKFNVKMASSSTGNITLINTEPYSDKYKLRYSFLNDNEASYSGMAKKYSENFNLTKLKEEENIPLKLDILCQDYKKGLFGKNFIVMTDYKSVKDILQDLNNSLVKNIETNLIGYNQGGYYDNTLTKIKLDHDLGSKKDYNDLINYAKDHQIDIYYQSNPLVATTSKITKKTIKRSNLELFTYTFKSSLEQIGEIINPTTLDDYFLKYTSSYDKLQMNNFYFDYVGSASFSYRYKSDNIAREQMIQQLTSSIETILASSENYNLALSKPNSYLYNYITSYYDTPYESSKYACITDSIPFIQLVLSGSVLMYASNTNYISDYKLFALRLIEYNIYPSFIITKESTSKLRYTNFEYLYTTEYALWEQVIKDLYQEINGVLKEVYGCKMVSHAYIEEGVCEVKYENGKAIYVNYNQNEVTVNGQKIPPMSSYLKGGTN